jgi:adenylate cyclase
MATEIERKFLVKNENWKQNVESESRIKQGYLARQKNATIRVRVAKGKALLNIKSATSGISRSEFEYEIPIDDAEALLQTVAEQPFIDKTRYKVRCGAHLWDLDVFEGENSGLIMAEVELQSENEPFELPDWAGTEVSGDSRYYNANLISNPFKNWGG